MQNTIQKYQGDTSELTTTTATTTLSEAMKIGEIFAKSGFFSDTREAAQCITRILAGRELGFQAFQSMNGIYIVKGKISIGANLMAARVKASEKYDFRVIEMTDTNCAIEFFERGESIGVSSFSIQEARKAGTQNTDKFPRNMLFARAMSNGIRWYTPDVFMTPMYTPDELGAVVDEEGAPVAAQTQKAPVVSLVREPSPVTKAQIDSILSLASAFWGEGFEVDLNAYLNEGFGSPVGNLTFDEAESVINALTRAAADGPAPVELPEGEIELSELDPPNGEAIAPE